MAKYSKKLGFRRIACTTLLICCTVAQASSERYYKNLTSVMVRLDRNCPLPAVKTEKKGECRQLIEQLEQYYNEFLVELKKTEFSREYQKLPEPCLSSSKEVATIEALEGEVSVARWHQDHEKLKKLGISKYLTQHGTKENESEWIDHKTREFVIHQQADIIETVCGSGFSKWLFVLINNADKKDSAECLKKISDLSWGSPDRVLSLLSSNRDLAPFLSKKILFHEKVEVLLSFVKNLRAELAKEYFNSRFSQQVSQALGVKEGHLWGQSAVIGFNRLFSVKNSMGASQGSDVDFNIVYNAGSFKKVHKNVTDADVKRRFMEGLKKAKEEFTTLFGIPFEVADFSVYSTDELKASLKGKDAGKLNFYATIMDTALPLAGNAEIASDALEAMRKTIGNEGSRRSYDQFVGAASTKGSIGVIEQLPNVKREGRKGSLVARKLSKTFEGDFVGSGALPHAEWKFSTKYQASRLYDYAPEDPVAQKLNSIALELQYMLIGDMHSRGEPDDAINESYDKITASQFIRLAKTFPQEVTEMMVRNCKNKTLSESDCKRLEPLPFPTDASEVTLKSLGFHFLSGVHHSAARLAEKLKPGI